MKILIIKPSSFGDIIQANPVLQALKTQWPDCRIDWLVFKQWKEAVEIFPNVHTAKVWDRSGGIESFFKILKDCKKENYDLVIDLQGLLRTALFAKFLKAPKKIGVSGMKEFSWLFLKEPYKKDPEMNAVLRNLKTVTYLTGKQYVPEFKINTDRESGIFDKLKITDTDKTVAFIPFARGKSKTWNRQHYLKLAEMIKSYNEKINIVIFGSVKDYGKIKSNSIMDLCGRTDIAELANLLKKCTCVIGADTGAMHLANAVGAKSVFIFGGSDIKETAPYGPNGFTLTANLECSPCRGRCRYKEERCLEEIKPRAVFDKIKQWIE